MARYDGAYESFEEMLDVACELIDELRKVGRDEIENQESRERRKKARLALAVMYLDIVEYLERTYSDCRIN